MWLIYKELVTILSNERTCGSCDPPHGGFYLQPLHTETKNPPWQGRAYNRHVRVPVSEYVWRLLLPWICGGFFVFLSGGCGAVASMRVCKERPSKDNTLTGSVYIIHNIAYHTIILVTFMPSPDIGATIRD